MIFVGDIALPDGVSMADHLPPAGLFRGPVVANLEGPIAEARMDPASRAVFNASACSTYLKALGVRAVSLANNHIDDLPGGISQTVRLLSAASIDAFGAGANLFVASRPALLDDNGQQVAVLGFGWEPIGCSAAGKASAGVNPLRRTHVIRSIEEVVAEYPGARIVAFMHWDYELEAFPQPAHREIAFAAIDAGASLVVGCHSHCVQGLEYYRGVPIAYGLGNWAMPNGIFWNGTLSYPPISQLQLALDWDSVSGGVSPHFFEYTGNRLRALSLDSAAAAAKLASLTPFAGMAHSTYFRWFRANRRKRKLLPIYPPRESAVGGSLRNTWVNVRNAALQALASAGLKKGPR